MKTVNDSNVRAMEVLIAQIFTGYVKVMHDECRTNPIPHEDLNGYIEANVPGIVDHLKIGEDGFIDILSKVKNGRFDIYDSENQSITRKFFSFLAQKTYDNESIEDSQKEFERIIVAAGINSSPSPEETNNVVGTFCHEFELEVA